MPQDLTFDVTAEIGSGESLTQTAWLFLPDDPGSVRAAILCLAGGTYDKHYWHLEIPGHPGYSFAEHLAAQGFLVVALDHLGVGGSTDPQRSGPVGLELLAKGDAAVATQLRERLREGSLAPGLPPLDVPFVGAGHSMGSCLTTMVQAQAHPYDAVVLLGYGVQISNVYDEDNSAGDLEARIEASTRIFREQNGVADGEEWTVVSRDRLRQPLFNAPDVPAEVMAADDAVQSRVPVRAASEVTTPGFVQRYTTGIDVPVFLGLGGVLDVSPDPHAELGNYRRSRDATLHIVEGSAHCHNFSGSRAVLWDRIGSWIPAVTAGAPMSVLAAG